MELRLPEQIDLDATSNAKMEDAKGCARRLDARRPLPPEDVLQIEKELFYDRVHNSNAIEGNTLERRETVMVLKGGKLSGKKKRDEQEARNLGEAAKRITDWKDSADACHTIDRFLDVHGIALHGFEGQSHGRFRERRVMIDGAVHQPPDHSLVLPLMERLLHRLNQPQAGEPILLATWAHWGIARVHPFLDGNGRMARLWQDLVLFQGGLTCAIIRPEERREYLDALGATDEGEFNPLVQLVADRVARAFGSYETVLLQKSVSVSDWAENLAETTDARVEELHHVEYSRWASKMERLRMDFGLCASKVTEASKNISVQVRDYDIIDQSRWENLRSGLGAKLTWLFVIDFKRDAAFRRYIFYFGKHLFHADLDNPQERSTNRVCVLISEDDGSGVGDRLDDDSQSPITLREVFVVDENFVRKRVNDDTQRLEYERGVSSLQIAQDFIQEVLRRRLT